MIEASLLIDLLIQLRKTAFSTGHFPANHLRIFTRILSKRRGKALRPISTNVTIMQKTKETLHFIFIFIFGSGDVQTLRHILIHAMSICCFSPLKSDITVNTIANLIARA